MSTPSSPPRPAPKTPALPDLSTKIKQSDYLIQRIFVWPTIVWLVSIVAYFFADFSAEETTMFTRNWGKIAGIQIAFPFVAFFLFKWATVLIDPDKVGIRQFISGNTFFTNCRIIHQRWFTQLVRIPSGQIIVTTEKREGKFVLTSQVKQTTVASLSGKSDKLWFLVKFVGRLDVRRNPEVVTNAWFRKFRKCETTDEALQGVSNEVLSIAIALCDEALQQQTVEDLALSVGQANGTLLEAVRDKLADIGFEILQVTIEDMEDLVPGGFLSRLSEMTRAELASQTQIATAAAQQRAITAAATQDKIGRQAQAGANRAAALKEMEARSEIADEQKKTLKKEKDVKKELELIGLQGLIQLLEQVEGKDRQILFSKLAQMDSKQITECWNTLAENAAPNIGGSLVLLGSDIEKLTGPHAIGSLAERFLQLIQKI